MRTIFVASVAGLIFLAGCATPQRRDLNVSADRALYDICHLGERVQSVRGDVWMKAKSPEAKGQFPAEVRASANGKMELEVTNLLGGTEAWIQVEGTKVEVRKNQTGPLIQSASGAWGGIPLRWASQLFLGRVPCVSEKDILKSDLRRVDHDKIEIQLKSGSKILESFFYQYIGIDGKAVPVRLIWKRMNLEPLEIDFHWDYAGSETGLARQWSAVSALGEVKLRWKQREETLTE